MKYSGNLVKVAFQSMLEILKQTIIANYKVRDVIWGLDHPLVKLANDILPKVFKYSENTSVVCNVIVLKNKSLKYYI